MLILPSLILGVNQPTDNCQLSPIEKALEIKGLVKRTPYVRRMGYEVGGNPSSKLEQTNRHLILGYWISDMHACIAVRRYGTEYLFT